MLPLTFVDPADYDGIQVGDVLRLAGVRRALAEGAQLAVENVTRQRKFQVRHFMSPRQVQLLLRGIDQLDERGPLRLTRVSRRMIGNHMSHHQ